MNVYSLTLLGLIAQPGQCCPPVWYVRTSNACPIGCSNACTCGCVQTGECRCPRYDAYGRLLPPPAKPRRETPALPPKNEETKAADSQAIRRNFGVEVDRLNRSPHYWYGDQPITKDQALAILSAKGLPDESRMIRVIVIGTDEECNRVRADVDQSPELAKIRSHLLVQCYSADDPIIKRRGYVMTGSPSITLVDAAGRVIARNLRGEYPGREAFAAALLAAVKPYVPANDPDLFPRPKWDIKQIPQWVWCIIAGVAALLLLIRAPKAQP